MHAIAEIVGAFHMLSVITVVVLVGFSIGVIWLLLKAMFESDIFES